MGTYSWYEQQVSILAAFNALCSFNQSSSSLRRATIARSSCMRRDHLYVNVYMSLLIIEKIDIWVPLVWSHIWRMLLSVNCAFNPVANELRQTIPAAIVSPVDVAPQLTEQSMQSLRVQWLIADTWIVSIC